ncbi:MAG: DUF72 domain-containing protein [Pseudomonadales bacterium]
MTHKIYFGLAQWHHRDWYDHSNERNSLAVYAKSFSSVEGNSSFYGLPSEQSIRTWNSQVDDSFRFCFKFPKEISHQLRLTHCSRQVTEFLNRISLIKSKLGLVWLQLDAFFDASGLEALAVFLQGLPSDFNYAVEVRHLDFFRKGDHERRYCELLQQYAVNRVIFDTRSLFANRQLTDAATQDALEAKPRVPTRVVTTGGQPMVRFIVPQQRELAQREITQWVERAQLWLAQGLTPYFFFHTPDNVHAPQFAEDFCTLLQQRVEGLEALKLWHRQHQSTLL